MKKKLSLIACAILFNASMPTCEAGLIFNIQEVGSDVVATGGGTVNLADLGFSVTQPRPESFVYAGIAGLFFGSGMFDFYNSGYTGHPSFFGSGGYFGATTTATTGGDVFGLNKGGVFVPTGYTSGSTLSGASTWAGETFSSLGLTPGTYNWTWGSGANADSAVVIIGSTSSVPEPGTMALALSGVLAYAGAGRRRKQN